MFSNLKELEVGHLIHKLQCVNINLNSFFLTYTNILIIRSLEIKSEMLLSFVKSAEQKIIARFQLSNFDMC